MPVSPRTTLAVVIAALLAAVPAFAAGTRGAPGNPPARIVFPVIGAAVFSDDFGARRSQGGHEGNDILAARHAPAVAAEAGEVRFWTTSAQAGCMLYLYGVSGTTYLYIHLNNDRGPGNDNRGTCVAGTSYAPGLKDGDTVAAGQLIGFVGDSGDADGLHPHLHFELHPHDGAAVSPFRWLRKAEHLTAAAAA
jgi:murein DD-endopeptidase MepM/ murein hydrolase activator NlpD